ncbi:hypothetical protein [Nostoc sp. FACHB-190]|uniref:hypothetical protein n=1 Tax=Nostoc sp. FACHB-190 TaxID=2692838 RepID=UPI001687AB48|nr:hypothetical protein [Nostoc sp. FACHB-190]MBD2298950.1 hypothetical protein [Nostoc sp. FACHB-190]
MAKAPKFGDRALSAKNIHRDIIAESSALRQEFSQLERAFQAITREFSKKLEVSA